MFNNNIPFGFSNNCGPVGCSPFSCSPYDCLGGFNSTPFSGWNNGVYGGVFGGVSNPVSYYGFNGIGGATGYGFPGYGFNSFNGGISNCSPVGHNYSIPGYNWNTPVNGFNNVNLGGVPFGGLGINNWSQLGLNSQFGLGSQFSHPMSTVNPFYGVNQGVGFPGLNSNFGSTGYNTPWMNWGSCFPGSSVNQFGACSPISGVSNWFSSPWMGYAYPGFQQGNTVNNGKSPIGAPVNGQFIPTGAVPYAPFNVPFQTNGYVPAGQGVNCEAA